MPSSRAPFGDRLLDVIGRRGRLCVGIDPHPNLLKAWGLDCNARGLEAFTRTCVEAFGPVAALVKPQVAFFESYGSAGFAVLEQALADLSDAGTLTIADAKRGDIGSTMAAYASAWLADGSPLACDALTVSPYLGFGSLQPAIDLSLENGRGLFILSATSNPEGASVQRAVVKRADEADSSAESEVELRQTIVDQAATLNAQLMDEGARVGSFGVVVGATLASAPELGALGGPILMPGVGAQGATAADVERLAGACNHVALPNMSRAILAAGPSVEALQRAVESASRDFQAV